MHILQWAWVENETRLFIILLCQSSKGRSVSFYLSLYHNFESSTSSATADIEAALQLQSILSTHRRDVTTQWRPLDCNVPGIQKYFWVPFACLQTSHKSLGQTFRWLLWHTRHLVKSLFLEAAAPPALVWAFWSYQIFWDLLTIP